MSISNFVSLSMVPITVLATATAVLIGVGLGTKNNRTQTIEVIKAHTLGVRRLEEFSQLWSSYFQIIFGTAILSKRQLWTIPAFTLFVSAGFFSTWILYIYIFNNEAGTLLVAPPPTMKQAAFDFYTKGIIATFIIVALAIQLTKVSIRSGHKNGYCSLRFYITYFLNIIVTYLLFSIVVLLFRVEDMVRLYTEIAPNDPLPTIAYAPFSNIASSLSLFHPPIMIHVTSQGWFSTYFMPEPLIFYCAATAQASLLGIATSYQIATALKKIQSACIAFITMAGTPEATATSVVIFIVIGLLSLPVVILSICAIVAGGPT